MNMNNKGFSLIEVIVALFITSIIGAGVITLQYTVGRSQLDAFRNYVNTDEADRVVTDIITELRNARQGDNGAYPIDTTDDSEIIFFSDINHDGLTERVRYTLTGNTLEKGTITPSGNPIEYLIGNEVTRTISGNIRNNTDPVFYYINGDWPEDTVNNPLFPQYRLADTRSVSVRLLINSNPTITDSNYLAESFTNIRILKDNY